PPVKVSLRSSWPAPPFVLEIIEAISSSNPDAFFPLLDLITDPALPVSPLSLSPEAAHAEILALARDQGYFVQPGEEELVKTALALHLATPKIEAFYQHYAEMHGGEEEKKGEECGSWVEWYGTAVCDVETLAQLIDVETIEFTEKASPYPASPYHVHPSPAYTLSRPPRSAVLYGSIDSKNFRELHTYLLQLSSKEDTHMEYIFRYVPPKKRNDIRNYLSGYGVALDLKKMDYLALDDRHSNGHKVEDDSTPDTSSSTNSQLDHILSLINQFPKNENAMDAKTPLTNEELTDLGLQAAHLLSLSKSPLETLTRLSQNFLKYAATLARRVPLNENINSELHTNSLKAQSGVNVIWLNGVPLQEKYVDVWHLARLLRKERGLMLGFEGVLGEYLEEDGKGREKLLDVIAHPAIANAQRAGGMLDGLFDASDREEGGDVVVWWNDMEKDSRYAKWQPSLYALLRPVYPGTLPSIRLNLFNLILVMDLSKTESVNFLAGPVASIMEHSLPFRFGFVPSWEAYDAGEGHDEDGKKLARMFYYLVENFGRRRAMSFIKISQNHLLPQDQTENIEMAVARLAFQDILEDHGIDIPEDVTVDFDAIVSGSDERLAVKDGKGHAFFNEKYFAVGDVQDFLRAIQMELMQQIQFFQEKVYEGTLSNERKAEISTFFYGLPTTSKRRNKYIFPVTQGQGALRIVSLPEVFERAGLTVGEGAYVYPPEPDPISEEAEGEAKSGKGEISISVYVVGNLDSEPGLEIIKERLLALDGTSKSRISFIHNPSAPGQPDSVNKPVSRLFGHLISQGLLGKADLKTIIRALNPDSPQGDGNQAALSKQEAYLQLTGGVQPKEFDEGNYDTYVKACRLLLREVKVEAGQVALVVNRRVVGPIEVGGFKAADFKALEDYEFRKRTEPVDCIRRTSMSSSIISSMQQPDPSEIGLFDAPQKPRMTNYKLLEAKYTCVSYELGDSSTVLYHVVVILQWLSNIPDTYIEIHLNPARYSEVGGAQLRFYPLQGRLLIIVCSHEVPALAAFEGLPVDPIYTLAMDVPSSWLVRPREVLYDLDNIQLGHLFPGDKSVDAIFELDYIVVDGHARKTPANSAPRGVQLELVATNDKQLDDTLVMANLGYPQFKAKPGMFKLQIREGRGRDVPTIQEAGSEVTVTSFEGLTLYPRLRRKPGMEVADVLQGELEEGQGGGVFGDLASKFMSMFGSKKAVEEMVPVVAALMGGG
ncbi:UDP-glucose:glycoprotein glucosyltransferase-domain-containing protein, partial [Cyathus striatus]